MQTAHTRPSEAFGLSRMYGPQNWQCLDFDLWVIALGQQWESEETSRQDRAPTRAEQQRPSKSKAPVTNVIDARGRFTGAVFLPGEE